MTATSPRNGWEWLRLVGNFVNLSTPFGLAVALIGRSAIRRGPGGIFLAEGYRLKFPIASAFTVGSVINTSGTWEQVSKSRPRLQEHEECHTWQYLYCLGFPFFVAYSACMAWSLFRTGDRSSANFFECQAGLAIGGYRERPKRDFRRRY